MEYINTERGAPNNSVVVEYEALLGMFLFVIPDFLEEKCQLHFQGLSIPRIPSFLTA
jgi:hypothetical protein